MEDPIMITDVEKAFYEMSVKGENPEQLQEYFFTYYSQKITLSNHVYAHMESHLPGYTDHGPEHVNRILQLYKKMLFNNISYFDPTRDYETSPLQSSEALNIYEVYLLLSATLWHDAGNIFTRHRHEVRAKQVQKKLKLFFIDNDVMENSLNIAKCHTGKDSITKYLLMDDNYHGVQLNLRFLAALLRLADELEEGEVRVDRTYYESNIATISDEQKFFWELSRCIKRIEPRPDNQTIEIHAKVDDEDACFRTYPRTVGSARNSIMFIDGLINKINKINETRKYYMRFLAKYVAFHSVEFKLRIGGQQISFTMDDDNGYDAFWATYPQLSPITRMPSYQLRKGR
jgi:hypothetical protein